MRRLYIVEIMQEMTKCLVYASTAIAESNMIVFKICLSPGRRYASGATARVALSYSQRNAMLRVPNMTLPFRLLAFLLYK